MTMNVAVIGTGYIGLISGVCLGLAGHNVICVDKREDIVQRLSRGLPTIFEAGLGETMTEMVETNTLPRFTTDNAVAIAHAEVVVIAVGTPTAPDGAAELGQVYAVANSIGCFMTRDTLVVMKSTVPAGTCRRVAKIINEHLQRRGLDFEFDVVDNPEFLREGTALADYNEGRIVIGINPGPLAAETERKMKQLYEGHTDRLIFMSREAAEVTKYAANAMLATRISFMNDLSEYVEHIGVNIDDVKRGIGSDPRIGPAFLNAGMGYGGACFPKDVSALVHSAGEQGITLNLLRAVQYVNANQRAVFGHRLIQALNTTYDGLNGKRICVMGLAFKHGTDDVRDSPAIETIRWLLSRGCRVKVYDEHALATAKAELDVHPCLTYHESQYDAYRENDAIVLCTESRSNADFVKKMHVEYGRQSPVVLDGRNMIPLNVAQQLGMNYYSVGRPPVITARFTPTSN